MAVAVGFIALAGVAAETGFVMLIYLGHAWGANPSSAGRGRPLSHAVGPVRRGDEGAVERVRPKILTLVVIPAIYASVKQRRLKRQPETRALASTGQA